MTELETIKTEVARVMSRAYPPMIMSLDDVAISAANHQNPAMAVIIVLVLLAIGFYCFIGTAPKDIIEFALAGVWALMAIAVVVSILSALIF